MTRLCVRSKLYLLRSCKSYYIVIILLIITIYSLVVVLYISCFWREGSSSLTTPFSFSFPYFLFFSFLFILFSLLQFLNRSSWFAWHANTRNSIDDRFTKRGELFDSSCSFFFSFLFFSFLSKYTLFIPLYRIYLISFRYKLHFARFFMVILRYYYFRSRRWCHYDSLFLLSTINYIVI